MPQPREITDAYRLEWILTSSPSASVMRATALASGQTVAVKLINVPPAPTAARAAALADRFTGYAAALGVLRHPGLPAVLDAGITPDGGAFLVTELLAGEPFDQHALASGGTPEQILPLLAQALSALEELARHGLAHLNLAPENLFLVPPAALSDTRPAPLALAAAGGGSELPVVKLLGLGTALFHLGDAWAEAETSRFRAPELALPAAAMTAIADWHADCYSLALTTCNALGATVAFGDASGPIVQMPLALSFELANDEALRQILEQSLRRVPAQRPAHAAIRAAFGMALGAPAPAPEAAVPAPPPARSTPPAPAAPLASTPPPPRPQAPAPEALSALPPLPPLPPFQEIPGAQPRAGGAAFAAPAGPVRERPAAATGVPGAPPMAPSPAPVEQPLAVAAGAAGAGAHRPKTLAELMDLEPSLFPASAVSSTGRPPHAPAPPVQLPVGAGPSPAPAAGLPPAAPPGPATSAGQTSPAAGGGRTGDDSFLDLLGVPELLPDLDAGAPHHADFGALATPAGEAAAVPTAAEMAAALGLNLGGDPESHGQTAGSAHSLAGGLAPLPGTGALPAPLGGLAPGLAGGGLAPHSGTSALPAPTGAPAPGQPGAARPAATGSLPTAATIAPPPQPPPPPPAAAPEPSSPGEMLSAVDDLLGDLPPAAALAAAPPTARGGRSKTPPPTPSATATGPRPLVAVAAAPPGLAARLAALPRPVLLGAAGGLAAVLLLASFLVLRHRSSPAEAAGGSGASGEAGDAASAPALRPGRSAAAKFFDAKSWLIMGRDSDGRVRQALHELSYADEGKLGEEGCRQLAAIEQTLGLAALETLPQELPGGVRSGDLGVLQTIVDSASDADVPAHLKSDFDRAKGLVRLYEQAQAAGAAGDQAQVLERFHAMEGLSRTLRDPLELRTRAAAALEAEAADLARDGKYDEAVGRLEPIRRSWPERGGLKDLLKIYETAAASEKEQQAILDNVPNYLRRRKPSEGLDLLLPLKPTPHLAQRISEAVGQLQAQLAQLDAQPPQVQLRDGYLLDYSRGQVVTLSFRATDDYEVKSVKFFASPEGGRMREMPLQKAGLGWTIDLPPSFHQNGTVSFYVVATDLSGHEGTLGSKEHPLQLKRRQGFERLLR